MSKSETDFPSIDQIDALFVARHLADGLCVKVNLKLDLPGGGYLMREASFSRDELVDILEKQRKTVDLAANQPVTLSRDRWNKIVSILDWHGKDRESELIVDTIEVQLGNYQPIETAPRDGTEIEVLTDDGEWQPVMWSKARYCILGAPQGYHGPGWATSPACDTDLNLPVNIKPTHWRAMKTG